MKTKALLLVGLLSATLSALVASEPTAMLLKAKSITVKDHIAVALEATVIVGDVQMSAAEITFDQERKTLKCTGETTIRANGATITAQSVTIEVGEKKIFMLSNSGIVLAPEGQADFDFDSTGKTIWLRPAGFDFTQKINQPR